MYCIHCFSPETTADFEQQIISQNLRDAAHDAAPDAAPGISYLPYPFALYEKHKTRDPSDPDSIPRSLIS